ncbi:MAG: alpha-hydroxy-acid oxidizing protein, partial [Gammaproteobacteria bacterium]|nr:alpha-hydroxy-acid oxidizing protein [Gammaproteobacteria bacterium]
MRQIHSSEDARCLARKRLPWMVFDYFDGAAGEGWGEAQNRIAIQSIQLQPSVLDNVENRSLKVAVFGKERELP